MPAARVRERAVSHAEAARVLAARDAVLAGLVDAVGAPKLARPSGTHFAALARSILYQQLAGSAAAAIHRRLLIEVGGELTPDALADIDPARLRAAGLSGSKAASLLDLAAKVADGTLDLDPRRIARRSDDELVTSLTAVRGIGPWTVHMFLLFQLRRLDVWPTGDYGVRRGYGLAFGVPMPTERELRPLGDRFAPYRSVVAWYCWRACEVYGAAPESALTT